MKSIQKIIPATINNKKYFIVEEKEFKKIVTNAENYEDLLTIENAKNQIKKDIKAGKKSFISWNEVKKNLALK